MKIFYERIRAEQVTWSTPYFTSVSLGISDAEQAKAVKISPKGTCLFDSVRPDDGLQEKFVADIKNLVAHRYIRIIPELCDDEGRTLLERAGILTGTAASNLNE